jgi:hypothetical protein
VQAIADLKARILNRADHAVGGARAAEDYRVTTGL